MHTQNLRRADITTEVQRPVAVVTGSSSGIGRKTAIELSRHGYCVVLHAKANLSGLQHAAGLIQQNEIVSSEVAKLPPTGEQSVQSDRLTRCILADIAAPAACHDFVSAAFAWRGRVDVWVNNAGADLLTSSSRGLNFEQRLRLLIDVDLLGTIRLSRLVAPRMLDQGVGGQLPTIINVGWDQAELGMEGESGQLFCTAKSAVTAFTRAFAKSVAPHIRVNCVAPGWIKTGWGENLASAYWDQRAKLESLLNRWGSPSDVASAIVWLAGQSAEFVNGQTINVNGGRRFLSRLGDQPDQ